MAAKKKTKKPVEPEKTWLTRAQMAMFCKISVQAFDKWNINAVGKIGRHRYWEVTQVIEYKVGRANVKSQAQIDDLIATAEEDEGAGLNPVVEKAKLDKEKRIGQELSNAEKQGHVFPTPAAGFVLAKVGAEVSAILESLPAKIKRAAPKMTATQLNVIRKEIVKACNAAADVPDRFDEFLEEYYT